MIRYHPARMILATLIGGISCFAMGQVTAPAPAPIANSDRGFIVDALQDGMAEVKTGQLAQQRGTNDQVKQFGARMVQDHGKAGDELRRIGESKGVKLPTEPSITQRNEGDKLAKLNGADFDKAYTAAMVKGHEDAVKSFTRESTEAKDPDVKAFATRTLPTLQEHLKLAQAAQRAVGGSK